MTGKPRPDYSRSPSGVTYQGAGEYFTSVEVNYTLTFLFDHATNFESHYSDEGCRA